MIKEEIKKQVWEKGEVVDGYDPEQFRKDVCGAWIVFSHYGNRNSDFGWEIDHIYPESRLEIKNVPEDRRDNLINLRPLNWRNNESKSSDYPIYLSTVTSEDTHNILEERRYKVAEKVRRQLEEFYKDIEL